MKYNRIRIQPTCLAIIVLSVTAAELQATTNSWTSLVGGAWTDGANWSDSLPPSIDWSHILIANINTKTITIDAATPAANLTINNLALSAPNGFTNTLQLLNVTTNQPLEILNALAIDRGGALNITNSAVIVDGINGGNFNILAGSVMLDGGIIDGSQVNYTRVGRSSSGTGSLTINSGSIESTTLFVGEQNGAQGVLTVNGGTVNVTFLLSLGETINSTGTAVISGGQLAVTNGIVKIGNLGTGQLVVSGGAVKFFSEVRIADNIISTGIVSVIGGQLIATNGITSIGKFGVGQMTISNATVLLTNVSVGRHDGAVGTLTVLTNGSLLLVDDLSIGRFSNAVGNVLVNGGLLSLTNDRIWVGREGIGQMTVSNGLVKAKSMFIGISPDGISAPSGTLTLAGGNTVISSNLLVGTTSITTGYVFMVGGSLAVTNTSSLAFLGVSSGTFRLNGGTITTDNLRLTNSNGQFVFTGGTLNTKGTVVANGSPFVVGDGTNAATLRLLGGTHSFANSLIISSNATLTGCGTIIGTIVNNGTISTNCSAIPATIISITKTGTTASISFTTVTGQSYTVEYKNTLNDSSWTQLLPALSGTGAVITKNDTSATVPTRIYRVSTQ